MVFLGFVLIYSPPYGNSPQSFSPLLNGYCNQKTLESADSCVLMDQLRISCTPPSALTVPVLCSKLLKAHIPFYMSFHQFSVLVACILFFSPHFHSFLICSIAPICFLLHYRSVKDKNLTKEKVMQSTIKTESFIVDFLCSLPLSLANSFLCFALSHIVVVMCNETLWGQGLYLIYLLV